jgi:hypothetical protein
MLYSVTLNDAELIILGHEAMRIGWGCPLIAPIEAIRGGVGSEVLGYINYFLPLAEMTAILSAWVIAIGAYYTASIVMRWLKAIS